MNAAWSDHERSMLKEMWLAGAGSGTIHKEMGRTRHAIRGMVYRLGLMGRRGEGLMHGTDPQVQRAEVENMRRRITGRDRRPGALDDVIAIMMAMAALGPDSDEIAAIAGVERMTLQQVRRELARTIWTKRSGPPARWWMEGDAGIMADATRIAARVAGRTR